MSAWAQKAGMCRVMIVLLLFFQSCPGPVQGQGALQTITYQEFEKLTQDLQAIYIAGILDGESFMLFSSDDPNRAAWNDCVRAKSLGETLSDVKAYVKAHPEEANYGIAWPLSKVIGLRRPCAHR